MDKSVKSKNTKFIIIVSIFIVIGVVVFTLITTKTNPFKGIVGNIVGDEVKSVNKDNYNGFYTKKDLLDATYKVFDGCSIYSIDNYILVQDDDFTLYRSTCMGTYVKDRGKTKDLKFDVENDKYVITYKNNKYNKDTTVNHVVENNLIAKKMTKIYLSSFPLVVKETEFEGNYYDIKAKIGDTDSDSYLSYTRDKVSDSFTLRLLKSSATDYPYYSYIVNDGAKVPLLYNIGNQIVVMEVEENENTYNYKFMSYKEGSLSYDLASNLPIKIDGQELNYGNNSIFIKFNKKDNNFTLFVGNDKKFCLENSNSTRAVSYIFKINYNYNNSTFDKPEYVKSIKGLDGCSEIESYMGD